METSVTAGSGCICFFRFGTSFPTNFLQMSYLLVVASGVDCSTFVRAMAIFPAAPVARISGLCLFFSHCLGVSLEWHSLHFWQALPFWPGRESPAAVAFVVGSWRRTFPQFGRGSSLPPMSRIRRISQAFGGSSSMYQWACLPSVLETGICIVLLQRFALARNSRQGQFSLPRRTCARLEVY